MPPVALILGATGAIGSAIARRLSARASVILHCSAPSDRLEKLARETNGAVRNADLTDEAATKALFVGLDGLDILVFAVGRPFPHKLAHRTGWDVFQDQLDSQIKALHLALSSAFPLLKGRENGARVLVISTEFVLGLPPVKIAPYMAAKSAMTSYARVIAQEWLGHGIRVQIIAPGIVRSALTADMPDEYLTQIAETMPEKRLTSAEDVADLADFLLSPAADSLYGTIVPASRAVRR